MTSMKKSFFGSLFTFQPVAVEEVRSGFQEAFDRNELAGDAPLVSYDQKTSSFSFQCDRSETRLGKLFSKLLRDYICEHQAEVDLLENQRIVPVHGTVIEDPVGSNERFSLDNDEGLVPFSEEEDSGEEASMAVPVGYPTEVWKPAKDNVGLLSFDVVKALSAHTGCTFSINSHRNEVRLNGGNLSDALSRLCALETILSYLYHPANAHVLMLYTAADNTRIDFTIPSDSALRRIIVDPDIKPVGVWLGNKQIEQLATYLQGAKAEQAFVTPSNLTTIHQCSTSIGTSTIWSEFTFTQVGDTNNQAPMEEASGSEGAEKLDPLPVSHYMTETESHMIEQWAGHVVETANPNEIIPDTPINAEGQKRVGRTRRVKQVEDDEDEEDDEQITRLPTSFTIPKSMNDALNSHFNAQKAKVGRTRIKKIDEDEDEDENEDEDELRNTASINDAEEHSSWTYPPLAEPTGFGYPSMQSKKRPGRQRIVKVDSDDEAEDNDPGWPVRGQERSLAGDKTSTTPFRVNSDEGEMSNGWNENVYPEVSHDWDAIVYPEMSNGWDETVYPEISSFGAINRTFEPKEKPTDRLQRTASRKDPSPDRRSENKSYMTTEEWSSFAAAETSKSSRGKEAQRKGRSQARGSRGQAQGPPRGASTTQSTTPHGRDSGSSRHIPQTSNPQYRGQSPNRGTRASLGTAPLGRSRGRDNQPQRGDNRFGALAADNLVDIGESGVVDPRTIPSPPGFRHHRQIDRQSVQAMRPHEDVVEALLNADLIDVTAPEGTVDGVVVPPPGFDCLSSAETQTQMRSRRRPGSSASAGSQSLLSVPNTGAFHINTPNPGMDLVEMSRRRLEQLHKARGGAESLEFPTENLQDVDESSTRSYHKTMNQKAKKPTPKKEAQQKRAEALQNAWGPGGSSSQSKASGSTATPSARQSEGDEMSVAKRRLLRGKESTTNSHPKTTDEEQALLQNDRFITALTPVFKAARAFPGTLNFEVQLGQFLSPSPEGAYEPKCVTVNQWHKLYDSAYGRLASAATFTNILTRNGADIDHILNLKVAKGGGAKLFHSENPGRFGIRFEFHCQGKNNDDFKLVFNSTGEYEIERLFRKIGQVNLHVPGQIWDAAGMLTGSTRFPEEKELKDAAAELAKSVYIPPGRKEIEISYRQPSSNEFAVKRVVMRRVSRHACAILDKHDIQLQITEVQRLFVERRSDGIYLAYASKYDQMVDQMMLHFEVSLISDSIERAMSANATLAVGDVTTAWTEESLLPKWRTKTLLELTHMVLGKMDGVGFHNVGSAVFFLGQESVLAGGSAVAIGSAIQPPHANANANLDPSMTKLATQHAQAAINVPGVRGGVAQPINQGYALGYGGARIPIPGYAAGEPDAVVPDDSASQAPESGEAKGQGQVLPGFW